MSQFQHSVLPKTGLDERAREGFVITLKHFLASEISPGNKVVYEKSVAPALETAGADITRHSIRKEMLRQPYYRMWSALQRTSQEMQWDAVTTCVERQLDDLVKASKNSTARGSLTLDPQLPLPKYHAAVDIHCQPGGYHTETRADDVAAGAMYDRAVYIYAMGRMGDCNEDMGASAVAYIHKQFPDFKPRRILDMGCAVGHSTIPYAQAFPEAEVHAIDVGAPMLRYAHARAQSLGATVHFSQQNAEATNFPDGHFDLIVSHILLHETSAKAIKNIMKEIDRLLSPGGVMCHAEVPQYEGMSAFDAFMLDWDTYNNNEPFWGPMHDMDLVKLAQGAGFAEKSVFQAVVPSAIETAAAKKGRTDVLQGGDFAGSGVWFVYGARKRLSA